MAAIMKTLALALCASASVQALNMNLRIGAGGRTINDFKRQVRMFRFAISGADSLHSPQPSTIARATYLAWRSSNP